MGSLKRSPDAFTPVVSMEQQSTEEQGFPSGIIR